MVFNFRQNEPVRRTTTRLRRVSGPRGVGPDVQQSQRKEPTGKFLHDGSVTVVGSPNAPLRKNRTLICPFFLETLRALYLADNDFEYLPPEIGQLKNLQIVRGF